MYKFYSTKFSLILFICIVLIIIYFSILAYEQQANEVHIFKSTLKPIKIKTIQRNKVCGEYGKPCIIKEKFTKYERYKYKTGWKKHGFNEYLSNFISVNRSLNDYRDGKCPTVYDISHFKTTIIICFHNEALTVLLRTINSIIFRTPPQLYNEIILIDDFSNLDNVTYHLKQEIRKMKNVKLIRTNKREGLIRARLIGTSHAKTDILTFLDSHIECTEGWLEPLLEPIVANVTTVTVPIIDSINPQTFAYEPMPLSQIHLGGFDWDLNFIWDENMSENRRDFNDLTAPKYTPTMPGGLFSIYKNYFEYIGKYDPDFEFWGGENLELSFKTWMCGGVILMIPCSHVGHIFRESPLKWKHSSTVVIRNLIRVAEVWMDEYKMFFYRNFNFNLIDYGNITDRIALRNNLGCNNFSWYLKNVYPEQNIPLALYEGSIKHVRTDLCLDMIYSEITNYYKLSMRRCHYTGGGQYWLLNKDGQISQNEYCVNLNSNFYVELLLCSYNVSRWEYIDEEVLRDIYTQTCLSYSEDDGLYSTSCINETRQQWNISKSKIFV